MATEFEEQDIARGEALLRSAQDAVDDLRCEIQSLALEVQATNSVDEAAAKQALSKLRDLVNQCIKAEIFLNECRSKQVGVVHGGHALDLERARAEIGCKLGRLRRCCGSGTVSG